MGKLLVQLLGLAFGAAVWLQGVSLGWLGLKQVRGGGTWAVLILAV